MKKGLSDNLKKIRHEKNVAFIDGKLCLHLPPFLPMFANFNAQEWQARLSGKKPALVRACKLKPGMRIIDATAGWGRDAAILASYGADVLMLERHPLMAALLEDALAREKKEDYPLKLRLIQTDAKCYLDALLPADYPDLIYIDPMHPQRQKSALVKKDLQILQQLIGYENDYLELIRLAQQRALERVVVKWPQHLPSLLKTLSNIEGKTVRFDIYPAMLT